MAKSCKILSCIFAGGLLSFTEKAAFLAVASSRYSGLRLLKHFTQTECALLFNKNCCSRKPIKGLAMKNTEAKINMVYMNFSLGIAFHFPVSYKSGQILDLIFYVT